MWVSMAEASAATTIHVVPVMLVYRSGGACLRHARPHHLCCPLYVVSSAVALPKRLHRLWVTGRLWTISTWQESNHSRGDGLSSPCFLHISYAHPPHCICLINRSKNAILLLKCRTRSRSNDRGTSSPTAYRNLLLLLPRRRSPAQRTRKAPVLPATAGLHRRLA